MKVSFRDYYGNKVEYLVWDALEVNPRIKCLMHRPTKFIYIDGEKNNTRIMCIPFNRPLLLPFIFAGHIITVR